MSEHRYMEEARELALEWAMPETEAACEKAIAIALATAERRGMERERERVRAILTNLLERIRPIIPRELHGQLDTILDEARKG